ncbi:MAG: hypothetical protein R2792_20535 [Saprospiraceae bacterium]
MIRTLILLVFRLESEHSILLSEFTPRTLINGISTNLIAVDTDGDMFTDVWERR